VADAALRMLSSLCRRVTLCAGDVIYAADEPLGQLFVVEAGEA
jgi:hypothetical protein